MGLFDKLRETLGEVVSEAEKSKDDIQKGIKKVMGDVQLPHMPQTSQMPPQSTPRETQSPVCAPAPVQRPAVDQFARFDTMISTHFADVTVRRNVPASELKPGCHPACTPVQFLFYKNGAPALAVVLVRTNTYRGMNVIGTKRICEELGITYVRFYEEYENAEDYVVSRIRKFL